MGIPRSRNAVSVDWELPLGFKVDSFEWPYPNRIDADSFIGFGYENEVYFLARVTPPEQLDISPIIPSKRLLNIWSVLILLVYPEKRRSS